MFFSKRGINLAKEESIQTKLNKKLLTYVFKNKDFPDSKSELKKVICEDNVSFQKSFANSYKLLELGNILVDNKLNINLIDIYEIEEIEILVNILVNILHDFQKPKMSFERYLISENINEENIQYSKELPEHLEYFNLELAIKDLFDRFVFAKVKKKRENDNNIVIPEANGKYILKEDLPDRFKTVTELVFRDILDLILKGQLQYLKISESKILEIVKKYYYEDLEYIEYKNKKIKKKEEDIRAAAINGIKNSIITTFISLEVFISEEKVNNTRIFKVFKFKSNSWKMNAKTKQDTIKSLIGGITNITNVSDENKRHAKFILDFIG